MGEKDENDEVNEDFCPGAPELEAVALDVWLAFLGRAPSIGETDFERLCARRPELDGELRKLRSREQPDAEARLVPLVSQAPEIPLEERLRNLAVPLPRGSRFETEGVIARGGMGVIRCVRDVELNRRLALKEMDLGSDTADSMAAARFLEEAQVTAQLDHPGIVPVHELGLNAEGHIYFAMKLVRGSNLRAILDLVREGREGWTQTRALGVLLRVCEAMAYAHSKGVIHRDLKPGNVMVGDFGEVYVMDWGLARVLGRKDVHDIRLKLGDVSQSVRTERWAEREETPDSPLVTMDGVVVGTPAYMPPEQARGEVQLLSPRSDVYAIGAMLYHLLTGQMPYVRAGARLSKRTMLARVVDGPPSSVRELSPDAPVELVAICEKAMARAPEERYSDTLALDRDLRAYLEGRVVRAHETGGIAEIRKWIGRNKELAAASAAAVVVLIAGLATSSNLFVRAAGNAERADSNATLAKTEMARANHEAAAGARRTEEVLRLSALQDLDDLTSEAQALWPVLPESAGQLEDWLGRARQLLSDLPEHERKLAELEQIGASEDRWWRNQLAKLIAGVKALDDPETGLIAGLSPEHGWGIQKRLDFARSIRERSVDGAEAAERWRVAIASIRDRRECPLYDGLELTPQLGLLPIGRDPDSGLWEFAHLETGDPPERGTDGRLVLRGSTGLVFVLVPAGSFLMGAQNTDPAGDNYLPWAEADEISLRRVSLAPFFLSKYEMTQGQWLAFAGFNPSECADDNLSGSQLMMEPRLLPVEMVRWVDCAALLERLGLTLPTEAQWEYSARAGTTTIWWSGDDASTLAGKENLSDRCVYQRSRNEGYHHEAWLDDGVDRTGAVGSYDANPFGLHDVQGNVMEWCRDVFAEAKDIGHRPGDGLAVSVDGETPLPEHDGRSIRGGSWQSLAIGAACAGRRAWRSRNKDWDLGIRPARPLTAE